MTFLEDAAQPAPSPPSDLRQPRAQSTSGPIQAQGVNDSGWLYVCVYTQARAPMRASSLAAGLHAGHTMSNRAHGQLVGENGTGHWEKGTTHPTDTVKAWTWPSVELPSASLVRHQVISCQYKHHTYSQYTSIHTYIPCQYRFIYNASCGRAIYCSTRVARNVYKMNSRLRDISLAYFSLL